MSAPKTTVDFISDNTDRIFDVLQRVSLSIPPEFNVPSGRMLKGEFYERKLAQKFGIFFPRVNKRGFDHTFKREKVSLKTSEASFFSDQKGYSSLIIKNGRSNVQLDKDFDVLLAWRPQVTRVKKGMHIADPAVIAVATRADIEPFLNISGAEIQLNMPRKAWRFVKEKTFPLQMRNSKALSDVWSYRIEQVIDELMSVDPLEVSNELISFQ